MVCASVTMASLEATVSVAQTPPGQQVTMMTPAAERLIHQLYAVAEAPAHVESASVMREIILKRYDWFAFLHIFCRTSFAVI